MIHNDPFREDLVWGGRGDSNPRISSSTERRFTAKLRPPSLTLLKHWNDVQENGNYGKAMLSFLHHCFYGFYQCDARRVSFHPSSCIRYRFVLSRFGLRDFYNLYPRRLSNLDEESRWILCFAITFGRTYRKKIFRFWNALIFLALSIRFCRRCYKRRVALSNKSCIGTWKNKIYPIPFSANSVLHRNYSHKFYTGQFPLSHMLSKNRQNVNTSI